MKDGPGTDLGDGKDDPDTNLAFWGTGNGGATIGDKRRGDN